MSATEPEPDPDVIELAAKLFNLARAGETKMLSVYVDAGVPADLANDEGNTLLMLAAYNGQAATVEALVARGADPDRTNDRGQTPIAGAVFKWEPDVVRALLAGGADPESGQPSAVETAHMFGNTEMLAWFERHPRPGD